MPIQNIDNYLMPSRSQETSFQRTAEVNKIPAEQNFLTGEVRHQAERKLQRTNETEKTQLGEDAFDPRNKGNNKYFKREKKKKDKKEGEEEIHSKELLEKMKGSSGRLIDIKL